ncbi:MAG: ATP-binding protein [Candidatus Hodarchaeales archaeon]
MVSIGTVIATSDSPSLEKIEIIIDDKVQASVERGQLVTIPKTKDCLVIGSISGIKKSNAYFERLDSSIYDNTTRDYQAIFPIDEWENTYGEVKPLGEIDLKNNTVFRLKFPVSPGSKVYIAPPNIVEMFLGLESSGLYLGDLYSNKVKVRVNLSRMLRKHVAILAISGAGKSYAATILLEEIHKDGRIGVFVIDPHGEYSKILSHLPSNNLVEILKGSLISIGIPDLSEWDISEFIPEISVVQTRVLGEFISGLKSENRSLYTLNDIMSSLEKSEKVNSRTKDALIGWLHSLSKTYLFSYESSPSFENLIQPGKIVVLDLSDIQNLRSRQILTLYFLKKLYKLRMNDRIPPCFFVIEEAHQFCPESHRSISKRIIETIAREGRKFYCSLCLISQRPVNLSVTALSQCNTNIILRIRNPYDLDFIGRTSEGISRYALKMLPDLDIGEAILVGEAINYPIFFQIRNRTFFEDLDSQDLEKVADKFINSKKYQNNKALSER